MIGVARPGDNGMQNFVYNGHKRKHALKFQATVSPDGMFLPGFRLLEGRRHDWDLYSRSGLDEQLAFVLQCCIYGDSGYNSRPYLDIPFQGAHLSDAQHAFHGSMSSEPVTVEWMFKELKLYWRILYYKGKFSINESPVASVYLSAVLLKNIRNTIYANPVAQYFECELPRLEAYLSSG